NDGGGTANGGVESVSRTFTVTVNAVNDAPTLDAIAGVTVNEDVGEQFVALAGIGSGAGNESQTLVVSASSSNTGLIPTPGVTYTSANAGGSISFTPVANANGTATITVTVNDGGGTANGGVESVSRTFTVAVTAVNDAPTLDAIANATIPEDSGAQTVNLAGIGSGAANESQTLTVTASSSNTGLIPNPSVTYASANTGGSISFTPVANASGTATISVSVSDGGGTANSGVDSVTRTFTVTVVGDNDAPVAVDQTLGMREDEQLNLTLSATDPDGGAHTFTILSGPSHGLLTTNLPGDTNYIYLPARNFAGLDSFTFRVTDNGALSATGTVSIVVTNVIDLYPYAFTNAMNINAGSNPVSIVSAKFYKKADLAVANFADNTVKVFLGAQIAQTNPIGLANGLFTNAAPESILHTGNGPVALAAADFNGDTLNDLVVVNKTDGTVRLYFGLGTGQFTTNGLYAMGAAPSAIAVGDLNKDGIKDLVVANEDDDTITVRLGQGGGTFGGALTFPVGARPSAVAIGDFNKDMKMDVVVANYDANTVSILRGNGLTALVLSNKIDFAVGQNPTALLVFDFNKDGRTDIVTANYGDDTISVLRGVLVTNVTNIITGKGPTTNTFALTNYPVTVNPSALATADLNKDKLNDLVIAGHYENSVSVMLGRSNAVFEPFFFNDPSAMQTVGTNPISLVTGLFNADMDPDVAVANWGSGNVSILLNNYTPVAYGQKINVLENTPTLPPASRSTWITLNGTYGPLNYVITSGPTNGTFVETNGAFSNSLVPLQLRYQAFTQMNGKDLITFYVREYTTNGTGKTSKVAKVEITILPVNDPPDFSLASNNITRTEDAGMVAITNFAVNLDRGSGTDTNASHWKTEKGQTIFFVVTNSLSNIFKVQPSLNDKGLLKFELLPNAFGVATVGVVMNDKGGTANGGKTNDPANNQTFTITVVQSNDTPTLKVLTALKPFNEDTNATTTFAVADVETPAAGLTYSVLNVTNAALFPDASGPAVVEGGSTNFVFGWSGTNRTLTVAPGTNQFGTNVIWIRVSDGTNNVTSTQTVTVAAINDAPSFTVGTNVAVTGTNGVSQAYAGWATGMSTGPANESAQTLSFVLVPSSTALFTVKPAISNAANGTLTFKPKAGSTGTVNVSIYLKDSGSSTSPNRAFSGTNTFSITVSP
ncbi:MAG: tandem-95 repeat protein, partial [Verrucomicrobia bacterium]|nr:tandem-95 repeat protein [Verrucomicrobiota bacterium]